MESTQLKLLVDKKNVRWFQILSKLELSQQTSTTEMTQLFEISTRTIHSDIKEIKDYFNKITDITSSNKGYIFKINDKVAYINKKKRITGVRTYFNNTFRNILWKTKIYFRVVGTTLLFREILKKPFKKIKSYSCTLPANNESSYSKLRRKRNRYP